MRPSHLIALCLLFPALAFAEGPRILEMPCELELASDQLTASGEGDVAIEPRGLVARFGLRTWGSAAEFSARAPIVIGQVLEVRSREGSLYRWTVLQALGEGDGIARKLVVDVAPAKVAPPTPASLAGSYPLSGATVNGAASETRYPALQLFTDGTYSLGGARGTWTLDEMGTGTLLLRGPYAYWGAGRVHADGSVHFQFVRGPLRLALRFSPDETGAGVHAPVASR